MQWLLDFMAQGGPVLYWLLALCVLLWSLILDRLWYFYREMPKRNQVIAEQWQQRQRINGWNARKIRAALISQQQQAAEQHLSFIGILIAVCPLMGLLGTVTGMVHVFDVLAITGTGNARSPDLAFGDLGPRIVLSTPKDSPSGQRVTTVLTEWLKVRS